MNGEFLSISAASVRAHLHALRGELREARSLGREAVDVEEQIDEAIWLLTKLSVVELALADATLRGRNHG